MKLRFSSGDIYLTQISSLSRARIRSKELNNSKFTLPVSGADLENSGGGVWPIPKRQNVDENKKISSF